LIADGVTRAAVVYDPSRDECFSALRGRGAWLNGTPLRAPRAPATLSESIAMVDLKRLPGALASSLAHNPPYRSQRSFGSVALDWCWVASGRCQVYLHGGQRLWDYAAGQLILSESGAVGGLLNDYAGDWLDGLSLKPRIALAATHADLLAQWRARVTAGLDG
jgi:myo-inositol-1(or 4)-monophosphatase